jgi:hypothetical protein
MRTTVDLDADVFGLAKQLAAKRGLTAGQIISDLPRGRRSRSIPIRPGESAMGFLFSRPSARAPGRISRW